MHTFLFKSLKQKHFKHERIFLFYWGPQVFEKLDNKTEEKWQKGSAVCQLVMNLHGKTRRNNWEKILFQEKPTEEGFLTFRDEKLRFKRQERNRKYDLEEEKREKMRSEIRQKYSIQLKQDKSMTEARDLLILFDVYILSICNLSYDFRISFSMRKIPKPKEEKRRWNGDCWSPQHFFVFIRGLGIPRVDCFQVRRHLRLTSRCTWLFFSVFFIQI